MTKNIRHIDDKWWAGHEMGRIDANILLLVEEEEEEEEEKLQEDDIGDPVKHKSAEDRIIWCDGYVKGFRWALEDSVYPKRRMEGWWG